MELEAMKKLIKKYEPGHLGFTIRAEIAERYYQNEADILFNREKVNADEEEANHDASGCD